MRTALYACLIALIVAGCRRNDVPEEPAPEPPVHDLHRTPNEVLYDTLSIEGLLEPVLLKRYDEPGIPFTTYYPADVLVPGSFATGEGLHVHFAMTAAGLHAHAPFIGFFFPSDEITIEELKTLVRHRSQMEDWRITSEGPELLPRGLDWAIHRVDYQVRPRNEWLVGTILIGQDEGRMFSVEKQYPSEFGEGFLPRADLILEHFDVR